MQSENTLDYPFDTTKITWRVALPDADNYSEALDDVSVYPTAPDGTYLDDADQMSGVFYCMLVYPNKQARKRALQTRRLGRHEGNVVIVFPNDRSIYASIFCWRNSAVTNEDLTPDTYAFLDERTLMIPLAVAKRIHPQAFKDMWASYQWCADAGDLMPTTISGDADYRQWKARADWNAQRHQYAAPLIDGAEPPAWTPDATFGDGTPVPQEYQKPMTAWAAEGYRS